MMKPIFKFFIVMLALCIPILSSASPEQAWDEAMMLAQQGKDGRAIALMQGATLQESTNSIWAQRFSIAMRLLELRSEAKHHSKYMGVQLSGQNQYEILMSNWLATHPAPEPADSAIPSILASIIPGSGHAWMGRWGDAGVAAMLVWPLLILTFWAARREMGPVTVFFAIITAWLWSGTVFSATSLAERGDFELYYAWWQEMWIAAGLPSRPW